MYIYLDFAWIGNGFYLDFGWILGIGIWILVG